MFRGRELKSCTLICPYLKSKLLQNCTQLNFQIKFRVGIIDFWDMTVNLVNLQNRIMADQWEVIHYFWVRSIFQHLDEFNEKRNSHHWSCQGQMKHISGSRKSSFSLLWVWTIASLFWLCVTLLLLLEFSDKKRTFVVQVLGQRFWFTIIINIFIVF